MTNDNTIDIEEVARAIEPLYLRMGKLSDVGVELDRAFLWEKLQEEFPGITLDQIDEAGTVMARNITAWFQQRGFPV